MRNVNSLGWMVVIVVLVAGCNASLGGGNQAENEMLGKWQGNDRFGQTMEITLKSNGDMLLEVNGGSSFTKSGTYSIDTRHDPAHFDIRIPGRDEIRTICQINENDQFVFENINSSDERPESFGENRIVMARQ